MKIKGRKNVLYTLLGQYQKKKLVQLFTFSLDKKPSLSNNIKWSVGCFL